MTRLTLIFFFILCIAFINCGPGPANNIKLPSVFSDNMVLQRDQAIPVWGTAGPGGKVTVKMADQSVRVRVARDSSWRVELAPIPAGGPHELAVIGRDTLIIANVLIGEVWVCSGQSNMEMPLAGWGEVLNYEQEIAEANYPSIRLFHVEHTMSITPLKDVNSRSWRECSPETIPLFSSTAYFFGRHLHQKTGLPIGLIHTSWGGTVAEAWTSGASLIELPDFADAVRTLKEGKPDEAEMEKMYQEQLQAWLENVMQKTAKYQKASESWKEPDINSTGWKSMNIPQLWEKAGLPNFDGVVWFRKEINLPDAWVGKELTLHLGPIDDIDVTYFNGTKVGSMDKWNDPRVYKIPASSVRPGRNVIAVMVIDTGGGGGIWGTRDQLKLESSESEGTPLAGKWYYRQGMTLKGIGPRPQPPSSPNRPAVLYNAMLKPLIPCGIRGAIWYQGESNASRACQYRTLFPTLIRDWRKNWGQGDFPFYFVQLANFRETIPEPVESDWAELREAQLMTLALPNTGMAVTIDIGDAEDIHPKNKQDVGNRLALIARQHVYGEKNLVHSGPIYKSMAVEGDKVRLHFDHVDGGLVAKGGKLKGFAIAGEDKQFCWAEAWIDGESVVVFKAEVENPVAVRYAWANNPVCNLYNQAGLPASPFRTDEWPGVTVGAK